MRRRKLCVTASSRTMLAFENNAHVLLLRFIAGNVDVNTLASKRSELIGNTEIVRKRLVIHDKSTCVCLRLPVSCHDYAETQASTNGREVSLIRLPSDNMWDRGHMKVILYMYYAIYTDN